MNFSGNFWPLLKDTGTEFQQDEAEQLGAALAYYAMFSIFPLLLLLLAAFGVLLGSRSPIEQQIITFVATNVSEQLSGPLTEILDAVKRRAGTATGIGLVTLLLGASGVFQQLKRSFNKIWDVEPKKTQTGIASTIIATIRDRLIAFAMVLAVGLLLLLSLVLTGVTNALLTVLASVPLVGGSIGFIAGLVITIALNTLIFALLFKYLPDTSIRWGDVWVGALVTAILWEIAKRLLALYVEFSSFASAYGVVGTALVIMVWIYFSSQILFLGAEFCQVYARRHGSHATTSQSHVRTLASERHSSSG